MSVCLTAQLMMSNMGMFSSSREYIVFETVSTQARRTSRRSHSCTVLGVLLIGCFKSAYLAMLGVPF